MADDKQIAALLRERASLKARGQEDRVAQVDAQLKFYGHVEPATEDDDAARDRTRRQLPQGRMVKPQQIATERLS